VVATAAISAVLILRLSLGLAILYGLVVIVWYELLRSAVLNQIARRRSNKARAATFHRERSEQAELAERKREREAAEQEAAEESEPDPARRHYYLARKAAKGERDVAVEAASEAAKQAIERIERRCREIDRAIDHEETERVKEMLRRPSSDKTP
jgi:biopolymer transport protein ExbB/TolQ